MTIITDNISIQCILLISLLYHQRFPTDSHSVQICTGLLESVEHQDSFPTRYLLNFASMTLRLVVVVVLSLGITWSWARNGLAGKVNRKQVNVLTLKQTIILIIFLYLDYLIASGSRHLIGIFNAKILFAIEMSRVLLIENILLKFILPLFLIIKTKSKVPLLWAREDVENVIFFMTQSKLIEPQNYELPQVRSTKYAYLSSPRLVRESSDI